MLKKILLALAMFYGAMAFAAVDVNKATAAQLDGIKGLGPALSGKILDERKKGDFKSWDDFITRVSGIGEGNASKLSAEGLTVGTAKYSGPSKAGDAKKDDKKADAKKDDKKTAAATATATKEEPKKVAATKEEPKKAEAKKEEPKAAAAPAKAETKKDDTKTVATAAKPAASAAKK